MQTKASKTRSRRRQSSSCREVVLCPHPKLPRRELRCSTCTNGTNAVLQSRTIHLLLNPTRMTNFYTQYPRPHPHKAAVTRAKKTHRLSVQPHGILRISRIRPAFRRHCNNERSRAQLRLIQCHTERRIHWQDQLLITLAPVPVRRGW